MSCAESIVYENVCIGSKLLCKISTVLGLASIKTGVLKKNSLTCLKCSNLCLSVRADNVLCEGYSALTEKLVKSYTYGLKSKLLLIGYKSLCKIVCSCLCLLLCRKSLNSLLLLLSKTEALGKNCMRLAHVRAKNNLCALAEKILDSRKCANNSLVRGNNAILHRYVEIATNQHGFAGYVDIFNVFLVVSCHFLFSP